MEERRKRTPRSPIGGLRGEVVLSQSRQEAAKELLLFLVFEELFAESLASEVDPFLEGLALLLGDEGVIGDSEGYFGDLVLSIFSLVEAEDYLGGDDTIVEVVELTDFLVGEVLELLRCVEMDGLDCQFHSSFLLLVVGPWVGQFVDFV